jgi:hypothetical protein
MNWLKINKKWLVLLLFDAFSFMCIKCMKHIHSFIPKFNTRPFIFCSFGANVYALKTDELNVSLSQDDFSSRILCPYPYAFPFTVFGLTSCYSNSCPKI